MTITYDWPDIYDTSRFTYDGALTAFEGSGDSPDIDRAGFETPTLTKAKTDAPVQVKAQ